MTTLIRYRVRPDAVHANRKAIAKVFTDLHDRRLEALRYLVMRLDDGVSFAHLVIGDGDPLATSEAFGPVRRGLHDRLVDGPPATW